MNFPVAAIPLVSYHCFFQCVVGKFTLGIYKLVEVNKNRNLINLSYGLLLLI